MSLKKKKIVRLDVNVNLKTRKVPTLNTSLGYDEETARGRERVWKMLKLSKRGNGFPVPKNCYIYIHIYRETRI